MRYYDSTKQYSITALTDASGTIKERYAYDAYGGLSVFDGSGVSRAGTAEGNRYLYTGRERDEVLDLYHYRARMYDAVVGRFLSRDPIGFEGSPWNLYEFLASSPLHDCDPSGKMIVCVAIAGFIGDFLAGSGQALMCSDSAGVKNAVVICAGGGCGMGGAIGSGVAWSQGLLPGVGGGGLQFVLQADVGGIGIGFTINTNAEFGGGIGAGPGGGAAGTVEGCIRVF